MNLPSSASKYLRQKPAISRRVFIAATAALPFLSGCQTSGPNIGPFVHRDGIGRRADGPLISTLGSPFGTFRQADRQNWWRPEAAVDSFSRLDEIFPSAVSHGAEAPSPWSRATREPSLHYTSPPSLGGGRYSLDEYLDRNPVTGLLIARGDTILVERYQYARTDAMRLTSFSMAKTLIALLVGLAVEDGRIRSIDDLAHDYEPALADLEYGRTPIRHLLTMSSGVRFREEYDGTDDSARLSRASFRGQSPGGAAVVRQFNERISEPGRRWYYASAETFVLAMVVQAAFRRRLEEVFAERIWQPIGAEANAAWLTDRSGLAIGYMGFNATLRDYARLGRALAAHGSAGGRQVIPKAWIVEMTRPAFTPAQTGRFFGYGFQTWVHPSSDGGFGLFGVRGQFMFVEPSRKLIMVNTAVRLDPRDRGNADSFALWEAVRSTLA